jgi:hypothetical protein
MSKQRFKVARFIFAMDADSMYMVGKTSKKFTRGNSSEAIRLLISKGYDALEAENRPQMPEKAAEPATSQVSLL